MNFNILIPYDLIAHIAKHAKEKRLSLNLTQTSLAARSGVSLGTLKKFERSGHISLESLLKLALVLEALPEFTQLFLPKSSQSYPTLNQLLQQKTRKRGRV
ncbi:MAG: helix-turn-helix transcriptional regulator [Parachlamydiaceae bacterium]